MPSISFELGSLHRQHGFQTYQGKYQVVNFNLEFLTIKMNLTFPISVQVSAVVIVLQDEQVFVRSLPELFGIETHPTLLPFIRLESRLKALTSQILTRSACR